MSKLIALILVWLLQKAMLGETRQDAVRFVEFHRVSITDAFWKPLLDRNRAVTIQHNLSMCREAGIVANFERVAGLRDGDYYGLPNWDEFLYKDQ